MVRKVAAVLLGGVLMFNSGCSTIRDELRYPGGAAAKMLDQRTFDASRSKQLQLLRAVLAIAIAARIGEGSISPQDGDAFARQLAEASLEVSYAAVDAGFPVYDEKTKSMYMACQIGPGKLRPTSTPTPLPTSTPSAAVSMSPYFAEDEGCRGFYTNFEANLAKIESRIVRAMLTSLPTDKAREFLNDLTKGDLVSALWSLAQSAGDIAGAFHRGAGVYRAGTETLAAASQCQFDSTLRSAPDRYDERYDTVMVAAACLGVSLQDLFDRNDIDASQLPNSVPNNAFHALFRVARGACVALPLLNTPEAPDAVSDSQEVRRKSCALVRFDPRERPHSIAQPQDVVTSPAGPPNPSQSMGPLESGAATDDTVRPEDLPPTPPPSA